MEFVASVEAGDVIQLVHSETLTVHSKLFVAERALRILPNRSVDFSGGRGPWALFEVSEGSRSGVTLRVLGHARPNPMYLNATIVDGELVLGSSRCGDDASAQWFFHKVRAEAIPSDGNVFDDAIVLADNQRAFFRDNGFLVIRGVVDSMSVEDARRTINHLLGKGPDAWHTDESGKTKLLPSQDAPILALVRNPSVWTIAQRFLGRGCVAPVGAGQLAVRFPIIASDPKGLESSQTTASQWHVDGMEKSGTGLPFSLLVKVALSDQSQEGNGNFTVFPGSHTNPQLHHWYQLHRQGPSSLQSTAAPVKPDVGMPQQVCLAPGDAVFVHPLLAHCVGRNVSANIRYRSSFVCATRTQRRWVSTLFETLLSSFQTCDV
jgi:hypothetical protein